MFTKALVPLDGTELAEGILPYVSQLSKGLNMPLVLLSVVDLIWLLLPVAAIGAQVYWLLIFVKGARDYHV